MNSKKDELISGYSKVSFDYRQQLREAADKEEWSTTRILLSRKRKEVIGLVKKVLDVSIPDLIDYTGSPFISLDALDSTVPESVNSFLKDSGNFLVANGNIYSRGHSYYFLYDGLSYENNENPLLNRKAKVEHFKPQEFCLNIQKHVLGIFNAFETLSRLSSKEINKDTLLRIDLLLIDQLKNIVLFLLNFCLLYFDPKIFGTTGKGENLNPIGIFNEVELAFLKRNTRLPNVDMEDCIIGGGIGGYGRTVDTLLKVLPYLESNFASLILNPDSSIGPERVADGFSEIKNLQEILMHGFGHITELFNSIDAASTGGKHFAENIKSKAIKKLIRHNREEDNFLFMLQSTLDSLGLLQSKIGGISIKDESGVLGINTGSIPKAIRTLDVVCPLYGGAEMPFIMQAIGDIFAQDTIIQPRLIAYSYYDLKNANSGINIDEYPTLIKNKEGRALRFVQMTGRKIINLATGTWCLLLDDNVYTGRTLNDFKNRFNQEYLSVFTATTATKTIGSKALNYNDTRRLLKEVIPTSSYSIPDKGGRNGIVYKIGKRLQGHPKN